MINTRDASTNTAGAPAGFGIPGVGVGILHPTLAHRFRMMYGKSKRYNILTMQTTKVEADMVNGVINCWIEQAAGQGQEMINVIAQMARSPNHELRLEMLDGNEGIVGVIAGYGTMSSHKFVMDYSLNEAAVHHIVFRFTPSVC